MQYRGGWETGSIDFAGNPIDFAIKPKPQSRRLVVVFNSQQHSSDELKLFTWVNVAARFQCSVLHLADPTLYLSETAKLGWYTCNFMTSFQEKIIETVGTFFEILDAEELVFVGSSGGGFPAAFLSQIFAGSTSLLLAPTLSVLNSFQKDPTQVYLKELNRAGSFDDIQSRHPELELSVPQLVSKNNGELVGAINILQSRKDKEFWKHHTAPFLESLDYRYLVTPEYIAEPLLTGVFGDWTEGHGPPPIEITNKAVDLLRMAPVGEMYKVRLPKTLASLSE